jgi:hypothetical protein
MTNDSHVQPDGTVFPPVTPDPPYPPGYEEPVLLDTEVVDVPEEAGSSEEPPD